MTQALAKEKKELDIQTEVSSETLNESGLESQESESLGHETTLFAEPVKHFKYFNITNALLTSWFALFAIIVVALFLRSKLKEVPKGIQNFFEVLIEGSLSICDQVTNDRKLSLRIFPVAITAFFFVLINNWFGILPLGWIGLIEVGEHGKVFVPLFRGATADINTTLAIAIGAVIGANVFGVVSIGLWKTFNKYVNLKVLGQVWTKFRKDPTIVLVAPVTFFVGIIEIVGELAKVASLSFRLFGNIFAGEVLLASMAAIMAYAVPIPFLFLEIIVGIIQAMIFSMLLVVYFTVSASDHDHEEHENHANEHDEKHQLKHA